MRLTLTRKMTIVALAAAAVVSAGQAAEARGSEQELTPKVPPGAVRLVNFDRHGDHVAVCAEEPGPAVERGSRTVPRTRVWVGTGGQMRQVATEVGSCDPAWSPQGTHVALAAVNGLWVLSRDLTTTTHLVNTTQKSQVNEFDDRFITKPAWSSDGARIGFLVSNGGTSWVAVVDAKTGEQRYKSDPETYSFRWEPGARALRLGATVVEVP